MVQNKIQCKCIQEYKNISMKWINEEKNKRNIGKIDKNKTRKVQEKYGKSFLYTA